MKVGWKPGQRVRHRDLGTLGTIKTVTDVGDKVLLRVSWEVPEPTLPSSEVRPVRGRDNG